MEELEEFSLRDLSKRKDFDLASATTRWFSKERTSIEGNAPRSTKLIEVKLNKEKNTIDCSLLVSATDKYGPAHVYKSVNPKRDFAIEGDPSGLYTINISFLNLNQIYNLAKSRKQKKKFNPQDTKRVDVQATNISIEEIKMFLWDSDFKIFCDDVSWQYQGANYKLSQLGGALFPTDIPPTHKHLGPDGKTRMGWLDVHPMNSILTKHTLEFFIHIKFFLNQIAGAVLKQLKNPTSSGVSNPIPPETKPIPMKPTSPITPPVKPTSNPVTPIQKAKVQAIQKQPIANQIMANNDINSPINQEIDKSNDYQGNQNENPANINKEDEIMPESWSMSGYGPKLTQIVENKEYQTYFNTKVEHLQNRIIELDSKYKDYEFEFNSSLNLAERTSIFNKLTGMKEVTIQFESGEEESRYKGLIRETLKFIKENNFDVVTFESTLKNYEHAHLTKVLVEVINLAFPQYKQIIGNSNHNNDFIMSLINENVHLTEIDQFPGKGKGEDKPTGKTNIDNPKSELPPPPTKDANIEEGKTLVCAFGSFNPPTKLHLKLLKSVLATAKMKKSDTAVFIQRDTGYDNDSNSVKQRGMIVTKLSSIHCITDDIITDFNSAMDWAYNKGYTNVMVIAGSDQVSEMSALIKSNNNKDTDQGHFKFENYKVGSYGDNNPDESKDSKLAVNAALDGNESEFISILDFSDVQIAKRLYVLAVNQLKTKAGLTESKLNEMTALDIYYYLCRANNEDSKNRDAKKGNLRQQFINYVNNKDASKLGTILKNSNNSNLPINDRATAEKNFEQVKAQLMKVDKMRIDATTNPLNTSIYNALNDLLDFWYPPKGGPTGGGSPPSFGQGSLS